MSQCHCRFFSRKMLWKVSVGGMTGSPLNPPMTSSLLTDCSPCINTIPSIVQQVNVVNTEHHATWRTILTVKSNQIKSSLFCSHNLTTSNISKQICRQDVANRMLCVRERQTDRQTERERALLLVVLTAWWFLSAFQNHNTAISTSLATAHQWRRQATTLWDYRC